MKGIVTEIRGNHAAVLTDEGCVIKVSDQNYAIGQVIPVKKRIFGKSVKTLVLAATAAVLTLLVGVSAWAYCAPYGYVSLDVNPSIEYTVNRFGRVLSAKAVDQDAVKTLKSLNLNNQPIDHAVRDTIRQIGREGYFQKNDPGAVLIATYSPDERGAETLAADLQKSAKEEMGDSADSVEVESVRVGYDRVQEARTLGTTPGKLNLVEKLQNSMGKPSGFSLQTWLNQPVKKIMKAIQSARKTSKSGAAQEVQESSGAESGSTASSEAAQSAAPRGYAEKPSSSSQPSKKSGAPNQSGAALPRSGQNKSQNAGQAEKDKEKAGKDSASAEKVQSRADSGSGAGAQKNGAGSTGSGKSEEKSNSNQKANGHSNRGNGK